MVHRHYDGRRARWGSNGVACFGSAHTYDVADGIRIADTDVDDATVT
jgi:hypothetical protein